MNVLKRLHDGEMSEDQVFSVYDEIMRVNAAQAAALLELSQIEWTAFCHGAPFHVLADWRYNSWPSECHRCGKKIIIENFGWLARKNGKKYIIRHIDCKRC